MVLRVDAMNLFRDYIVLPFVALIKLEFPSVPIIVDCDCRECPAGAYKEGEDLLTDDFARECKDCGRIITPDEFTDIIEEHDYAN